MQQHTLNISDLRRGNYIEYNGKWERVQDIVGDRVTFMDALSYKEVPVKDCSAIHLDENVLKLTLFEHSFFKDYSYTMGMYGVHLLTNKFFVKNEFSMRHYIAPCNHLHTLQNIFYLLKEVELPINI